MTVAEKINSLKKAGSVTLTETEHGRVVAERSGDGRTLRFVRIAGNKSTVFSIQAF